MNTSSRQVPGGGRSSPGPQSGGIRGLGNKRADRGGRGVWGLGVGCRGKAAGVEEGGGSRDTKEAPRGWGAAHRGQGEVGPDGKSKGWPCRPWCHRGALGDIYKVSVRLLQAHLQVWPTPKLWVLAPYIGTAAALHLGFSPYSRGLAWARWCRACPGHIPWPHSCWPPSQGSELQASGWASGASAEGPRALGLLQWPLPLFVPLRQRLSCHPPLALCHP